MKPIVLAILDGVGIREEVKGNAFVQAKKPNFDYIWNEYPHSLLDASGEAVGLPEGQMGNSEVGHLNIGAGRVVYQPLLIINKAIKDKSFFDNSKITEVMDFVKGNNSKLHIMGLLSDGGVHSHLDHILALLEMCKMRNLNNIYFHIFTDGRDTYPDKAYDYIKVLEDKIKECGLGSIATISGRYYAMDRDKRWERVSKAYNALIYGEGETYNAPKEVIDGNYKNGIYDEFIVPSVIDKHGMIDDNDGIIFANFRPDRATEILTSITNNTFKDFETKKINNIKLVTLMPCAESVIGVPAFTGHALNNTLGIYLSNLGFAQLRIAETEKYAHITYFFDGEKDKIFDGCVRDLIPSTKEVSTYDLKPEMSAYEITDQLLHELDTDKFDIVILNYANGDMVGHTGNMEATIKAVEAVDYNLGRLYKKVQEKNGLLIVTADHGNCEYMIDEEGHIVTAHTTNKVPFIICQKGCEVKNGKLGDIAPTILKIMKIDIPTEMTGDILIS